MIFDTHAHYDSRQFNEDRDELLNFLRLGKVVKEGSLIDCVPVRRIVNVGADMTSSHTTVELSKGFEFIYGAVGVHPDSAGELVWYAQGPNDKDYAGIVKNEETCRKNIEELRKLASEKKVVAIGEIGLDYHWDIWPREIQKEAFRLQWNLAEELGLPVIIHSRDAAEDTMDMLKEFCYGAGSSTLKAPTIRPRAVLHCYSYSPEQAAEYLKMGLMFGIGGVVTFKNARKCKEVVELVPLDRILLETDCPYMAPDPYRGKRNHSGYITYVAETIADIKGVDVEEVYSVTYKNAENFFNMTP